MKAKSAEEGLEKLQQLEKKISRAIEKFQAGSEERAELRREVAHLRRRLIEQDQLVRNLQSRFSRMEKDRETVKARLQKVLDQVDSLAAGAEA